MRPNLGFLVSKGLKRTGSIVEICLDDEERTILYAQKCVIHKMLDYNENFNLLI